MTSNHDMDMENKLKSLRWETPAGFDQHIFSEADRWLKPKGSIKSFLYRQWPKAATVAALVALAAVLYFTFIQGPTLTLAQVQAAVNEQAWMHVKYDNGDEEWYDLVEGRMLIKYSIGYIHFYDPVKGVAQSYVQDVHNFITEEEFTPHVSARIDPWQIVVGKLEGLAKSGKNIEYRNVEKYSDFIEGKPVIRFDEYYADALGRKILFTQIWADPVTRLPVRIRRHLQLWEREALKREFATGEYDFPATGPTSIYDGGVPREVGIVKREKKAVELGIQQIIDRGKNAHRQFSTHYRLVTWETAFDESIAVIYRKDINLRQERYGSIPMPIPQDLSTPVTAERVLGWVKGKNPCIIEMSDGKRDYEWTAPYPSNNVAKVHVRRFIGEPLFFNYHFPENYQWRYVTAGLATLELLVQAPDLPAGCIALTQAAGDIRRDYYIDPAHDYIEAKEIWWKKRDGKWVKDAEETFSEFARLPSGHWYPQKRYNVRYPDPKKTIRQKTEWTWMVNIQILEENEYPAEAFNGEKLLQGAKIETD